MTDRRKAREIALQALYAWEVSGNSVDDVVRDMIEPRARKAVVRKYAETLVRRVAEEREEFDAAISARSEHWNLDRLTTIDLIIMRIALCEFLYSEDVPPKVAITEALEIAKRFSTEKSSQFINGMLDGLFKEWQEEGRVTASTERL